jgi:hypothetical protein
MKTEKKERWTIMTYRKTTLRKMDTNTRKLARLINDLDSALTRLKNFMPTVERMELESNALYSRLSTYEKKVFNQEHLVPEPASLFPEQPEQVQSVILSEIPHTDDGDTGPLFQQELDRREG